MIYTISTVLPFLVCGFWTAVFILDWKLSYPAKRILTVFMAVCTLLYLCHAVFFAKSCSILPLANSIYTFCTLAVFPLFYLYIVRLTKIRIKWKYNFILLPAILLALANVYINTNYHDNQQVHNILNQIVRAIFLLQLLPICYFGYKRLKTFDRLVENMYAETEKRTMKYTRTIMLLMLVCAVCSISSNHIGREYFAIHTSMLIYPSFAFSLILFGIGYCGLRQGFCIEFLEKDMKKACIDESIDTEVTKSNKDAQIPGTYKDELEKLERAITENKLFLNNDIRLTDIAKMLGMSRNALSSLINSQYRQSFSDFINERRIEYAKSIMKEDTDRKITIVVVAEQSGFTTETSFYRAFKKFTGMTPKQWIAKYNGQNI